MRKELYLSWGTKVNWHDSKAMLKRTARSNDEKKMTIVSDVGSFPDESIVTQAQDLDDFRVKIISGVILVLHKTFRSGSLHAKKVNWTDDHWAESTIQGILAKRVPLHDNAIAIVRSVANDDHDYAAAFFFPEERTTLKVK